MKILIVDDNQDSRMILRKNLEDAGHRVDEARHGAEALIKARSSTPELIISDILMPVMDGYKLCFEVKHDKKLNKIPIVFYTATYTDPQDERLAIGLGASKYILKPMEMDDFLRIIKDVVSEARQGRLPAPDQPMDDPVTLFRMYDSSLSAKLQDKVRELEWTKAKIEDEERFYRNLFNSMRDVILMIDLNRRILDANQPALRNASGYELDEIRGKKTEQFYINRQDYEDIGAAIYNSNTLENQNEQFFEADLRKKNGEVFKAEITISKIFNEKGKVTGICVVLRDVTDRKKLEDQLRQSQKLEAIGTLASGIAHDFNNILTALIGYSEMAMSELHTEADKAQSDLQEVLKAGERARALVDQILTFSRQGEQERKPLQIQHVVKEALKLLRASLPTTIEIRQNIDETCGTILADPTQIHQVIMNLCTNAYQAMRDHGGILGVTLKQEEISEEYAERFLDIGPGRYLKLEIDDTGSGIQPAIIEKIFEPYFTTKKKGEGTGLGLSVVHGIVKSHDGHISVYSEPGKGTTFKIYFPLYENASTAGNNLNKKTGTELPHGTERILVVDDEKAIVDLNSRILTKLGYQVTAVTSSNEALQLFTRQPDAFDLVITDMTMPIMTGFDLTRELLAMRADIPIILCTGFSETVNEQSAKDAGIKEYLMKPVERKNLAMAIRRALDENQAAAHKDGEE